ncbi:MAG: TIGR01620 family protein [Rhodobacteraceae bacterium]|nr:TIGR01620 family protein [Paracoccaceae bacterium]MCP5342184.1 TIGR01620 family protein [Paracoccaceae bacterium]
MAEQTRTRGPVLIDLATPADVTPATAPPVPDGAPDGRAVQSVARMAARDPSRLGRFLWIMSGALASFAVSLAAWNFVAGLLAANPVLGTIAAVLVGACAVAAGLIGLREYAGYARLSRLDGIHKAALSALASGDLTAARRVTGRLLALYRARPECTWGQARLAERQGDVFDADALLSLTEAELMAPLDRAARAEIEAAARQVATVTALVPLALADVAAALIANLRMVRRIAEIYGGRAGAFGSWRLLRTVFGHLVATGAVAVGDDLIHSVAGGGLLSKISRRFGEGVINGALTARVGVAAMEVCRPLPFAALPRPKVGNLVGRGLAGLFGTAASPDRPERKS